MSAMKNVHMSSTLTNLLCIAKCNTLVHIGILVLGNLVLSCLISINLIWSIIQCAGPPFMCSELKGHLSNVRGGSSNSALFQRKVAEDPQNRAMLWLVLYDDSNGFGFKGIGHGYA